MKKDRILGFIDTLSISQSDKAHLKFILHFFKSDVDKEMISSSYIFYGDPGVGKSYAAEKIIRSMGKDVAFYGISESLREEKIHQNFDDLLKRIRNDKEQIIYLDDINLLLDKDDFVPNIDTMRSFLRVLDYVKNNNNKLLISTINDLDELDSRALGRIDMKIKFMEPPQMHKESFLSTYFAGKLSDEKIKVIANNTVGYNYRDVAELVRSSYRIGGGKITMKSIAEAFRMHDPSDMYDFDIMRGIPTRFSDIIGCASAKNELSLLTNFIKTGEDNTKIYQTISNNVLFFVGEPGTGKTLSAKALAGELGWPLISIEMSQYVNFNIRKAIRMAKKYTKSVILIDEADKLMGGAPAFGGRDDEFIGSINSLLDGADSTPLKSIIVIAVNNPYKITVSLRNRCRMIAFNPPRFDDRVIFFDRLIGSVRRNGDADIAVSGEVLALATRDFNYRGMRRMWEELMLIHLSTKKPITEDVVSMVASRSIDNPRALIDDAIWRDGISDAGMMFG